MEIVSRPEHGFEKRRLEAAKRISRARASGTEPEVDATLVAWRREDVINDAAYLAVRRTWDEAADLARHPAYTELLGEKTWRERWVEWRARLVETASALLRPQRFAFASVLALVAIGSWLWLAQGQPDYVTRIAEVRELPLEDGSVVTLGPQSTMDVTFSGNERRVTLAGGEAFFSVAPNPQRPFVVAAGDTLIRVTGTKFNVNYEGGRVRVTVLEGRVEVARAGETPTVGGGPPAVELTSGQQAFDASGLPAPRIEPIRVADAGAWRQGRLSYQDAPLGEIIADANRYRAAEIRLNSPALARERITTSFRASQIDQMLATLPDTVAVTVRRNPDGTVDLDPVR
jgi:transmembrane sensor